MEENHNALEEIQVREQIVLEHGGNSSRVPEDGDGTMYP